MAGKNKDTQICETARREIFDEIKAHRFFRVKD